MATCGDKRSFDEFIEDAFADVDRQLTFAQFDLDQDLTLDDQCAFQFGFHETVVGFDKQQSENGPVWSGETNTNSDIMQDIRRSFPTQIEGTLAIEEAFEGDRVVFDEAVPSDHFVSLTRSTPESLVGNSSSHPDRADATQYDVCFGALVIEMPSCCSLDDVSEFTPADIRPFGDILRFHSKSQNRYIGMVVSSTLARLLRDCTVRLDSVIINPRFASTGKSKSTRKLQTKCKDLTTAVRIIIYGCASERSTISDLLSDGELYLQHPSWDEIDRDMQYDNPHFLVRPGSTMPSLGRISVSQGQHNATVPECLPEASKSQILRVFDSASVGKVPLQTKPSPRLSATLKEHQLTALAFMIEKESTSMDQLCFPSLWVQMDSHINTRKYRHVVTGCIESTPRPLHGGIIADDMGLGKTLSVLALTCASLDHRDEQQNVLPNSLLDDSAGTLIVAPKSTIHEWQSQINSHVQPNRIRASIYHGKDRLLRDKSFRESDVVITTYDTLRRDWESGGALYQKKWLRIVLDEAHHIRNRLSQLFKATCALRSVHRWCLTGTPIHNSLDDFGALLSFIGVKPFLNKSTYDCWITSPFTKKQAGSLDRLQELVRATCLRRTKAAVNETCKLPPRLERTDQVELSQADRALYEFFRDKISRLVAINRQKSFPKSPAESSSRSNVMSMMNVLRLICDHGERLLSPPVLQAWRERSTSETNFDGVQALVSQCHVCRGAIFPSPSKIQAQVQLPSWESLCINCTTTSEGEMLQDYVSPSEVEDQSTASTSDTVDGSLLGVPYTPSAKVEALLKNLHDQGAKNHCHGRPSKSVVFSTWTKMLDLIQQSLHDHGMSFQRIDGSSSLEHRSRAITDFRSNSACTVMLASIGSAGEGVDLTAADHVHLMEPHWNPMVEAQAVDRVHRIGQDRDVTIIRYIAVDTIESYVQWVQKEKIRLVNESINLASQSQEEVETRRWNLCTNTRCHLGRTMADTVCRNSNRFSIRPPVSGCSFLSHG